MKFKKTIFYTGKYWNVPIDLAIGKHSISLSFYAGRSLKIGCSQRDCSSYGTFKVVWLTRINLLLNEAHLNNICYLIYSSVAFSSVILLFVRSIPSYDVVLVWRKSKLAQVGFSKRWVISLIFFPLFQISGSYEFGACVFLCIFNAAQIKVKSRCEKLSINQI